MTCCGKISNGESRYSFQPQYSVKPVTEKFYARHDRLLITDPLSAKVAFYRSELEKRSYSKPQQKSYAPRTENQVYGWLDDLAARYISEEDQELMLYPKKTDDIMIAYHKIAIELDLKRRIFGAVR